MSNPTNFGASIVPPSSTTNAPQTTTLDSPALTPAVSTEDLSHDYSTGKPIPPHSPFYQHPPASFERVASHSRNNSRTNVTSVTHLPNEKDLEAGAGTPLAPTASGSARGDEGGHPFASKVSVDCSKECRMWPSKQTLMQDQEARRKRKREKRRLGNLTGPVVEFWHGFSKRQKLYVQIALALVLIGVAVAIAVGITVAVNGSVYVGEDRSKQIPDPNQ